MVQKFKGKIMVNIDGKLIPGNITYADLLEGLYYVDLDVSYYNATNFGQSWTNSKEFVRIDKGTKCVCTEGYIVPLSEASKVLYGK